MRVGFFTDTYFPQISGVATSIKTLKEELERAGHEVLIFTTSDPKATADEVGIVRLGSIPFVSFKDRRIAVSGMVMAFEKAKSYNLDIIHTHTEFSVGWLGKYIGNQLHIPVVHTYHTMYEDYLHYIAEGRLIRPAHVRKLSRGFCRNLSGVVCPSQRVVDTLKTYQVATPLSVIPTGVDLNQFASEAQFSEEHSLREEFGIEKEALILLSLSRLSYEKNIQEIIMGMPEVVVAYPSVKLLVVGDGPHRQALEELAARLAVSEAVIFVGEVSHQEVSHYYHAADYFVSASTSESQGLTYIEALASQTQLVVKGNDYLDALLDDSSLGMTYSADGDFAKTLIAYLTAHPQRDEEILQKKLYEVSSLDFGRKIINFYEEACRYHGVFIGGKKHELRPLATQLFKRR